MSVVVVSQPPCRPPTSPCEYLISANRGHAAQKPRASSHCLISKTARPLTSTWPLVGRTVTVGGGVRGSMWPSARYCWRSVLRAWGLGQVLSRQAT